MKRLNQTIHILKFQNINFPYKLTSSASLNYTNQFIVTTGIADSYVNISFSSITVFILISCLTLNILNILSKHNLFTKSALLFAELSIQLSQQRVG